MAFGLSVFHGFACLGVNLSLVVAGFDTVVVCCIVLVPVKWACYNLNLFGIYWLPYCVVSLLGH